MSKPRNISFRVLVDTLQKGQFDSAYLISGEEETLTRKSEELIVQALLTNEEKLFNLLTVYGSNPEGLKESLTALPVFADRRVTVVREAQHIKDFDLTAVINFLDNPPTDACLILRTGKIDARRAFYKKIKGKITNVECSMPKGSALTKWIMDSLKDYDKSIEQKAVERLLSVNWPNLGDLQSELEKLSLVVGDRKEIGIDDVEELGGGSFAFTWWKLSDAIGSGNMTEAASTLSNLMYWNVRKPHQLVNDVFRLYLQMWIIKWHIVKKKTNEAREIVGLPDFVFRKYIEFARKRSIEELENALIRIKESDFNIKQGLRSPEIEINLLISELGNLAG